VPSNARINQLNLPHRTKTKPDMLKTVSSQSPLCQSGRKREDLWWEGFVKEAAGSERVKELWMMKVVKARMFCLRFKTPKPIFTTFFSTSTTFYAEHARLLIPNSSNLSYKGAPPGEILNLRFSFQRMLILVVALFTALVCMVYQFLIFTVGYQQTFCSVGYAATENSTKVGQP